MGESHFVRCAKSPVMNIAKNIDDPPMLVLVALRGEADPKDMLNLAVAQAACALAQCAS